MTREIKSVYMTKRPHMSVVDARSADAGDGVSRPPDNYKHLIGVRNQCFPRHHDT